MLNPLSETFESHHLWRRPLDRVAAAAGLADAHSAQAHAHGTHRSVDGTRTSSGRERGDGGSLARRLAVHLEDTRVELSPNERLAQDGRLAAAGAHNCRANVARDEDEDDVNGEGLVVWLRARVVLKGAKEVRRAPRLVGECNVRSRMRGGTH